MDYEQKYNKLVNAIKVLQETNPSNEGIQKWVNENVPELKKGEDERIREKIIATIHLYYGEPLEDEAKEMIAWLEKQGKPNQHLELKAGNWYICHRAYCCRADHLTVKEGERFQCEKDGIVKGFVVKEPEKYFKECSAPATTECNYIGSDDVRRRSTIQVLEYVRSLDTYNQYGKADIDKNITWLEKQGQTFTKKDVDDAYLKGVCDAKQELEKQDEQKPFDKVKTKFHKGDWVVVSTIKGDRIVQIASVEYLKDGSPSYFTTEGSSFGNRTKARLLTDKDVEITTIPESRAIVNKIKSWSEEDEKRVNHISNFIWKNRKGDTDEIYQQEQDVNWLKSLKQRHTWKPSEKQIEALEDEVRNNKTVFRKKVLNELLEQLKKL